MKLILFNVFFLLTMTPSFSQSESENYNKKIQDLKQEIVLLEQIQKDYEKTIDSLYNIHSSDSLSQDVSTKMLDYYMLKTEFLRKQMILMVELIDSLNTIKKED